MWELLKKEFRLNPFFIKPTKKNWFTFILGFILICGLVAIEVFLFSSLNNKFSEYQGASFSFNVLFLLILAIICLIVAIFYVQKIYFNRLDMAIIINKPIDYLKIIFSKTIYCLIINYAISALINLPILFYLSGQYTLSALFGFAALFYPLFLSLFNIGVALILCIPIQYIYRFLKQYPILQLLIVALGLGLFCYLYSLVLNIFIDLLNNNAMQAIFNEANLATISAIAHSAYPYSFLSIAFLSLDDGLYFLYFLVISLVVLGLGITLIALFYVRTNQFEYIKQSNSKHQYELLNPTKAIIKKELILLFKENDTAYSFTSLIILQPVLTYLVINSINVALMRGNLAIYISVMPYLLNNFDLLLILLFSSVISLNAINIYKSESKTIRIMKFIPYSIYKHIYIKLLIPYFCSFISTLIAFIVLISTSLISVDTFFMGLLFALIINFSLMVISLKEQLKASKFNKVNNFLSNFLSFVIPLVLVAINIVLAMSLGWLNIYTYLIDLVIVLILLTFIIFYLLKQFKNDVYDLEVTN